MRTRCSKKRLASQGRGLRPGSACMCQADAHTPLQTRAVRQKGLASQGRGLRPGSARNVSGRCAHPAANAGGATKETCEPGARFASRLSPQCVRPMRTPRCKRGRCDKRDLRARGAVCVQAQPAMCQADAHTPLQTRAVRQKRLASQGRDVRPGSAYMCQADAHTPLQTRAVRQKRLASQGRDVRPGSAWSR